MKNSVNGRTFDEIFGQRGVEIRADKLVEDKIYLNTSTNYAEDLYSLFSFREIYEIATDKAVFINFGIWGDGTECNQYNENGNIHVDNFSDKFFEATTDQIALLKSYQK